MSWEELSAEERNSTGSARQLETAGGPGAGRRPARRGDDDTALVLIEEALSLLERSDSVDLRWEALADLAEVHRLAGRTEDAARALGQAIELVERKGVVPLIQRFRDRLDDLPKTMGE
jgi:Flp pilus assembly protein TadD